MTSDPATADAAEPRAWRPRIGLKSILLLMAAVCIALGGYAILERKTRAMVALNESIQKALQLRFVTQPEGADFENPGAVARSAAEMQKRQAWTQDMRIASHFYWRELHSSNQTTISLDLSKAFAANQENTVLGKLPSHLSQDLAKLGLRQTSMSFCPGVVTETWELPERGVIVVIDTFLIPQSKHAWIRSQFFHNDQATIF